jgi:hypothetical protein
MKVYILIDITSTPKNCVVGVYENKDEAEQNRIEYMMKPGTSGETIIIERDLVEDLNW